MEKIFTVDYFIDKFEKIPEDKWVTNLWYDYSRGGACANGHCGLRNSDNPTEESAALKTIFEVIDPSSEMLNESMYSYVALIINDGRNFGYQQPTPKQRILAALRDIKKLSKEPDVQASVATKLIVVPSAWPNKQSSLTNLIPNVDEVSDLKNVKQAMNEGSGFFTITAIIVGITRIMFY